MIAELTLFLIFLNIIFYLVLSLFLVSGRLTRIVEETGYLGRHGRHDGGVKQRVKSGKEQSTDNYGDKNLYAGIDIALSLLVGDSALSGNDCGIDLVLNFLKHILLPRLSSVFWCITD